MSARLEPTIFLVDDDESVLRAVKRLLEVSGYTVESFPSAQQLIDRWAPAFAGCIVADLRMPGIDGMELLKQLRSRGCRLPFVMLTGHGDISASVEAMRCGALNFLTKPVEAATLLPAVAEALKLSEAGRESEERTAQYRERFESLTPREREVCDGVVAGQLNKQIAFELQVAEKTVKVHRARVMQKMKADSVAALVRMVDILRAS